VAQITINTVIRGAAIVAATIAPVTSGVDIRNSKGEAALTAIDLLYAIVEFIAIAITNDEAATVVRRTRGEPESAGATGG